MSGEQFVLSSGIWFRVERKFMQGIDAALDGLAAPKVSLPAWDEMVHEDEFNRECCNNLGLVLFDKLPIMVGGGQSKFEFCDFLCLKSKTLFFAKIASRSSDCSHLVEQVRSTISLEFEGVAGSAFPSRGRSGRAACHPQPQTASLHRAEQISHL